MPATSPPASPIHAAILRTADGPRSHEASSRTHAGPQSANSASIKLKRGTGLIRHEITIVKLKISSGKPSGNRARRRGWVQTQPSAQTASPLMMRHFVR